jgi:hypothetical protein
MKQVISARFVCVNAMIFLGSTQAFASMYGLFPMGHEAKSAAMESALGSSEPQAMLYNPATLYANGGGISGELGFAKLLYRYEHPSYDPVKLNIVTPVASAGWASRKDLDQSFVWGLALDPSASSTLSIDGLPKRANGKLEPLNVKTTRKQFHLPIGLAWSPAELSHDLAIGASIIFTYDERKLAATGVSDQVELIDITGRGQYVRPNVGFTYALIPDNDASQKQQSELDVGASFTPALTKKFRGDTKLAVEKDPFDTETVDYDPATLMFAARWHFGSFNTLLSVNRIYAARGASIIRDGINRKTDNADVRDVNHYGIKSAYQIDEHQAFSAAYAYLPSIWGAGYYSVSKDGFSSHELGHLFGNFEAMPLHSEAIHYDRTIDGTQYSGVLTRTHGTHTIDTTGDNPGYYQLELITLSLGLSRFI